MKETRSKVFSIISEQFSVSQNEITDEIGPGDLAKWDSIGQLRLMLELEKQFNIKLSVDDVMSINNVRDMIGKLIIILKTEKNNRNLMKKKHQLMLSFIR